MRRWPYSENRTRRDFLKTLSLSLTAIPFRYTLKAAQAGTARFFSRQKTDRPQKVIAIGAGLSGLAVILVIIHFIIAPTIMET